MNKFKKKKFNGQIIVSWLQFIMFRMPASEDTYVFSVYWEKHFHGQRSILKGQSPPVFSVMCNPLKYFSISVKSAVFFFLSFFQSTIFNLKLNKSKKKIIIIQKKQGILDNFLIL